MLASVKSAMLLGVDGLVVNVEVHVSSGIPGYTVVGLPDAAVRESRERVRAALLSSGFSWQQRRAAGDPAPGGARKTGAGPDPPLALWGLPATRPPPPRLRAGIGGVGAAGPPPSVPPV